MGRHTLARIIIFTIAILLLLYSIFIATISFIGLNITAFHLSQPLLIGYGVCWLVATPSGLWGIFGSVKNNAELCKRYIKDHWFSFSLITLIDIIKIIFSFTMKDNSMEKCLAPTGGPQSPETAIISCRKKIDFSQKSGLVVFGVQEFILVGFGILIWFNCKRIIRKKESKLKVPSENDLEVQSPRSINGTFSSNTHDFADPNMSLERIETKPNQRSSSEYNKVQNEQRKIKKNKSDKNRSKRSLEVRENSKSMQRFDQQYTRPRSKSFGRQMTSIDEPRRQGLPPQGMNPMDSLNRTKSMAPPAVRSRNTMLPPPLPEYITIPRSQGMQNGMTPYPPYFNRAPLPQFHPNFLPPYPYQQWQGSNDAPQTAFSRGHRRSKSHPQLRPLPVPPGSDMSTAPSIPPIPKQQAIPPQIIEQKQAVSSQRQKQVIPPQIIERQKQAVPSQQQQAVPSQRQQAVPSQRQQAIPSQIIERQKQTVSSQRQQMVPSQRQQAVPSQQQQAMPPQIIERQKQAVPSQIIERQQVPESKTKNKNDSRSSQYKSVERPLSNMHRANSLPNLYNQEYLMRNEMLFAPPVPMIPPSLQPGINNNNSNKSNSKSSKNPKPKPPITNNNEKFERFIRTYGDKDYMEVPETLQYNKYSELQYNNNDYTPQTKQRPKSAHSVQGEARPKSLASTEEDIYYDDDYYYVQSSGYEMNQVMMNSRNSNYAYVQYARPIYNARGNFVQNPMGYYGGNNWANYDQQMSQEAMMNFMSNSK